MPSLIDPTQPPEGAATTAAMRANMAAAKSEIETMQDALAAKPDVIHDTAGNHVGLADGDGVPIPLAMVYAFPDTPALYCSPIAGDPDTTMQTPLHGVQALGTGFLLPKAGILTEIGLITQGSDGSGTTRNLRFDVCSLTQDPTAPTGLKVLANLLTGLKPLADNFSGTVVVATGLALAVPSQFMVFLKAPFDATGTKAQAMKSAGPIPGVVGGLVSTQLISTATYMGASVSLDTVTPPSVPANELILASNYKGISVYIKWKGQ